MNTLKKLLLLSLSLLIENDLICIADGDKNSVLNQLKLKELDPADALHVSIANRAGINFLTLDNRLKEKIKNKYSINLENIETIYYTTNKHQVQKNFNFMK